MHICFQVIADFLIVLTAFANTKKASLISKYLQYLEMYK